MRYSSTGGLRDGQGMVACIVVLALTFVLPLRVMTVSVTRTVIELGSPVSFLLGIPDSTPVSDSFSPLGKETFFHPRAVV